MRERSSRARCKKIRPKERGEGDCGSGEGSRLGYSWSFCIKGEGSLPGLCRESGILPLPTGRTTTREE